MWKRILFLGKQLQLDNQESGKEFWPLVQENSTLFYPDKNVLENLSHPSKKAKIWKGKTFFIVQTIPEIY